MASFWKGGVVVVGWIVLFLSLGSAARRNEVHGRIAQSWVGSGWLMTGFRACGLVCLVSVGAAGGQGQLGPIVFVSRDVRGQTWLCPGWPACSSAGGSWLGGWVFGDSGTFGASLVALRSRRGGQDPGHKKTVESLAEGNSFLRL